MTAPTVPGAAAVSGHEGYLSDTFDVCVNVRVPASASEQVSDTSTHDVMATVTFAVTEPPYDRLVVFLAGHRLRFWRRRQVKHRTPSAVGDLPFGVAPESSRKSHEIGFESGSSPAFYTDGLTDIRLREPGGDDLYDFRMARICGPCTARTKPRRRVRIIADTSETTSSKTTWHCSSAVCRITAVTSW